MRTRGATGSQPRRWRLQSRMSRRLHQRGLQFLTPLFVAGAAAQLADEGDAARDYEREYEQGFTEASAEKQERALEVIEIIAMLENVTLEAVGRTLAAFVVAHAAVLTTIAIVVRPTQAGSSVRTQRRCCATKRARVLSRCAAQFSLCLSPPEKVRTLAVCSQVACRVVFH